MTPEEQVYTGFYNLQNAVDDLVALHRKRPDLFPAYHEQLAAAVINLACLTNAVTLKKVA